ncbi:MAG TPA: hypothetical protein VMN39_07735 [Longimicrobiaceae bacterium]|nr:hypothetical protein [Longimicrobiaceae bacterium]
MKWIVILGFFLFAGAVVYWSITPAQTQCEVCLEFDGELVCRRGAGATEEAALTAAQESVCGGNVSGMSESIACRAAVPVRAQCTTN